MRFAVSGATGRMGAALLSLVREQEGDVIVGATAEPGCEAIGCDLGEVHGLTTLGVVIQDNVCCALMGADVVLDFSHPKAVVAVARAAASSGIPLVSGTTGLSDRDREALDDAARRVPVLWASNFSIGVHVLAEAVRLVARRLGPTFDVEVVEAHHRHKKDAPSGTALRLVEEIREALGPWEVVHGRSGAAGPRSNREIGVMAIRGGDVIGDHTVHFLGPAERLELTHRATNRQALARGALVAARSLVGRPAGRYSLADVLGD